MSSSLVIANFATGFETDREPFLIGNDAFPVLNNAYVWRGRIRKKRGTSLLGRLERALESQVLGSTNGSGVFTGNIISILTLNAASSFVPGSFSITIGAQVFTDDGNGILSNGGSGTGTINYSTGAIVINTNPVLMATPVVADFSYFPNLPVMGLEDFQVGRINFPDLVAFDTKYSYQFNQLTQRFYDVTFYKSTGLPFVWHGADYQQFWSASYQGAMWVTNGVSGLHFATITVFANIAASTTATITLDNPNLVNGDKLFFNEVVGAVSTINLVSGTITDASLAPIYVVTLDAAATVTTFASGIVLLLTSSRSSTGDGIKWYDGDPTTTPTLGWVNFSPPLSNVTLPQYLIGAKAIVPFKNRLLFFGVTIATSAAPGGIFYPNRLVYSENGTPYYSLPVPLNQVVEPRAWFQNIAGFGGFLGAPITQEIITIQENDDVLLTGYESKQLKLFFTGDDSLPFLYQVINSELGSQSTFSGVNLDTGALTIGDYGLALTTQVSAQRIDLVIPDQVFDISAINNSDKRVTAIRDYRNEFIYFTYPPKNRPINIFNSKTLLYNYRDNTWATFDENFTHYGTFRRTTNLTWATLNTKYKTWSSWTDPWNFGSTGSRYPSIIGGNQQGFVMIKDDGTYEDRSQYISAVNTTTFVVTSPNHCLNSGDYIEVLESIGLSNFNSQIYQIRVIDVNTFTILLSAEQMLNPPAGTYLGGGVYRRLTNIFIQSKQFPIFWEKARKTRIGTQRYLLENAPDGELTANIFTSQNSNFPSSDPDFGYLINSNILFSKPDPLQPFQFSQNQIWHRMSNSFNGDTIQIGFTMNDAQMRVNNINEAEITIHAIAFDIYPGPLLV